jgi:hypothetical protein
MRSYGEIEVTRSGMVGVSLEPRKLRLSSPVPTKIAQTGTPAPVKRETDYPLIWSSQDNSMLNRYYEKDGHLEQLNGKTVAIVGYGSQGHAHALNLRDSGANVVVALYEGSKSIAKAKDAGLKVMGVAEAAAAADMIMILVSDHIQAELYNKEIALR